MNINRSHGPNDQMNKSLREWSLGNTKYLIIDSPLLIGRKLCVGGGNRMDESNFELRKFVAPEFVIGVDARLLAGRYAKNFDSWHVLVVTASNFIAAGWVTDVTDSLRAEGIRYTLFSDVTPNPRDYLVVDGADLYQRSGCDCIVAVGGGSLINRAKGIGIVVSNKKHILKFEGVDNVVLPLPPLICIPTTAGSGADVSQFVIINDTERKVKNVSSPVTDVQALESIRLMTTDLLPALDEPDTIEFRYKTMLGGLLAGFAFSNSNPGVVHAMAHSLEGFSDLPHGACNACAA